MNDDTYRLSCRTIPDAFIVDDSMTYTWLARNAMNAQMYVPVTDSSLSERARTAIYLLKSADLESDGIKQTAYIEGVGVRFVWRWVDNDLASDDDYFLCESFMKE